MIHSSNLLKQLVQNTPLKELLTALGPDSQAMLVGGTVRDMLLGKPSQDLDLATVLTPDEIIPRLVPHNIKSYPTGIEHGTVTALIAEVPVEITTFRQPGSRTNSGYSQTIEEDLAGRDFTINAIAYSIVEEKLIDPFNGLGDLSRGYLKAVGCAEARFTEDPLRILRMFRFGPAQGRTIDPATEQAAEKLKAQLLTVSPERIFTELESILISPHAGAAFLAIRDLKILEVILPELLPMVDCQQNHYHTHDVYEHTTHVIDRAPGDRLSRWAALFHDCGKPHTISTDEQGVRHFYQHELVSYEICRTVLKRLRSSNHLIQDVSAIVKYHMRPTSCGASGVRRILRDLGPLYETWRSFKFADKTPIFTDEATRAELEKFDQIVRAERDKAQNITGKILVINGDDLIAIGIKPGPKLGQILKDLEERVIEDPEINEREKLLKIAGDLMGIASKA